MTKNFEKKTSYSEGPKPAPESGKKGGDQFINNPDHPLKAKHKHQTNQDSGKPSRS